MTTGSKRFLALPAAAGLRRILGLTFGVFLIAMSGRGLAASPMITFEIPAQPVASALRSFAEQADLQLLYPQDAVQGIETVGVSGPYQADVALAILLQGTNLEFNYVDERTVSIRARAPDLAPQTAIETQVELQTDAVYPEAGEEPAIEPADPVDTVDPETDSPDVGAIEEIIVTTRKRAERLQDVPISITAFTATDIEEAGIQNIDDVAALTPGFTVAPLFGGSAETPVIRGLSQTIGEPNVGFFIDGIYQSSRAAMEALLDNIERIEIAKGPQSALYGRNTFGGAVNFITRKPSNDWEFRAEGTAGDFNRLDAKASVSGPLVRDRLFFRAGATHFERGGFFKNELTGKDLDTKNTEVYHAMVQAVPNETLDIVARIAFEDTNDGDEPEQFVENNSRPFDPAAGGALPAVNQLFTGELPGARTGFAVTPGRRKRQNLLTSLAITWEVGDYTLSAITGYNNLDILNRIDNDFSPRDIKFNTQDIGQHEFSQELRITSPGSRRLRWMLGGYAYRLRIKTHNDDRFIGAAGPVVLAVLGPFRSLVNDTTEKTTSFAVFGQAEVDLSDQVSASVSGRYTHERKNVTALDTDPVAMLTNPPFVDRASFNNFVPRLSLDYHLSDNKMVYASVAKAVKAGGFNVVTATGRILDEERTFDPERSWNYEIGAKTGWFDNRLTFNITGFLIKWRNQIVRALGQTFAVLNINAGKTTSKGIEIEAVARPADGLDIRAGFAYTDSKYDDFDFTTLLLVGFSPAETQLAGTRLQFVSKYTANLSVQYRRPVVAGIDWFGRMDLSYQSDQSAVQPATAFVGDATLLNLRTGFETERYSLTFWVNNLLKENDALTGVFVSNPGKFFDFAAGLAGLGPFTGLAAFNGLVTSRPPRTWGVTGRVRF